MATAVASPAAAAGPASGGAAGGGGGGGADASPAAVMDAFLRQAKYPLVKFTDMSAEVREEAVDIAVSAVEKHGHADVAKCTQAIKEQMDRKFGSPWHVVVGKAFAYEITYEVKNILYLFVGGTTGVLLWKM